MWENSTWYWVINIHITSEYHYANSKWTNRPALWSVLNSRLPAALGNFCLTTGQLTEFSAMADVFLLSGISELSLQPVWSHWVSSKRRGIVANWLFQLQGNMNDLSQVLWFHKSWHVMEFGPLDIIGAFSSLLLSGSASSNLAPFCLPALSLPWESNYHSTAQLLEAGIIN